MKKHFLFLCVALLLPATFRAASAATSDTIVVDDFEKGAASWTLNDSEKAAAGVASLVDIVTLPQTRGGASDGDAARLSFKSGNKAWASASTRVDGAQWAKIGARSLTFWISGDGAATGTELVLRARYANENGGAPRDESFAVPVKLVNRSWRRVVIPLSDFRNASGPLLPRISGVYLLQFVQRGTWSSRFFTIDQIQVEGSGVPLAQNSPASTRAIDESQTIGGGTTAPPESDSAPAVTVKVTADFLTTPAYLKQEKRRSLGRVRTTANVSVGGALPGASAATSYPLLDNSTFRLAIKTLGPRYVRLEATALVDVTSSSRPSFDYSRLVAAAKQVRAIGAAPLISLGNEPLWGLDARGYAVFAAGAARAVNASNPRNAQLFELATATSPSGQTQSDAAARYNVAYTALKTLSKSYRVGGAGYSSTGNGRAAIAAFLKVARGLDFLTVSHFGAFSMQQNDATLMNAAGDAAPLRAVGKLIDASKFRNAPLFVTSANLNATRDASTLVPSDARNALPLSAAWWLSFLGNNSRVADQIFHNDAVNAEWGLLKLDAQNDIYGAYPAYYAMWLWNRFAPVGSERVYNTTSDAKTVSVFAVNARGAHNVLLSNNTPRSVSVKLSIRGFPKLRSVLLTQLDDPAQRVRENAALSKSATQTITLKPYAIATVQFLEPPK